MQGLKLIKSIKSSGNSLKLSISYFDTIRDEIYGNKNVKIEVGDIDKLVMTPTNQGLLLTPSISKTTDNKIEKELFNSKGKYYLLSIDETKDIVNKGLKTVVDILGQFEQHPSTNSLSLEQKYEIMRGDYRQFNQQVSFIVSQAILLGIKVPIYLYQFLVGKPNYDILTFGSLYRPNDMINYNKYMITDLIETREAKIGSTKLKLLSRVYHYSKITSFNVSMCGQLLIFKPMNLSGRSYVALSQSYLTIDIEKMHEIVDDKPVTVSKPEIKKKQKQKKVKIITDKKENTENVEQPDVIELTDELELISNDIVLEQIQQVQITDETANDLTNDLDDM